MNQHLSRSLELTAFFYGPQFTFQQLHTVTYHIEKRELYIDSNFR